MSLGCCEFSRLTQPSQSPLFQISGSPGRGKARAAAVSRILVILAKEE